MNQIDELLRQVQALKEAATAPDPQGLIKQAEFERDAALNQRDAAMEARDKAIAELEKTKAAVEWTMGKLLIADICFRKSEDLMAAQEGWLKGFAADPEDTQRIIWINRHGRMSMGEQSILFALPYSITGDEALPEIYNFRHFVDICRKTHRPKALPLP